MIPSRIPSAIPFESAARPDFAFLVRGLASRSWHPAVARHLFVASIQLVLVVLANYGAFVLRFDGAIPDTEAALWLRALPWLLFVRAMVFVPFGLYTGLWRYAGIWDLRNIIMSIAASSGLFSILVGVAGPFRGYPRSVVLIDAVLLVFLMGGARLFRRTVRELTLPKRGKRVLIYGAGGAGEMIVRDMKRNAAYDYEPVGFIDDDAAKRGKRIHGVRVLGDRQDLRRIMGTADPHEILIAIPAADPVTRRQIVSALREFKVPITTLPSLDDIVNGRVGVPQIRKLHIEDLLARAPIGLDVGQIRHLLTGKRVMVTGAGGSIGSELCRQIASLRPERLILYERYENALYAINNDLADLASPASFRAVIGDVTDRRRLDAVLSEHRPHLIFHAAAHKHVPLMQLNPCEAVKNNVLGTRLVAEAAARHGVERFILISTDKAVNPSSIMGATKRIAELIVQTPVSGGRTAFATVRFGNVLGSNGSVVPRFLDQIRAGGPVTVTHPEIRRFFMLIPEAVQLVLHAAALAEDGGVYVLDMGAQIKLVDLARDLIRLSGLVPDDDIPIVFTGLRPGEKLYEELTCASEQIAPSSVEKITHVRSTNAPEPAVVARQVAELVAFAIDGDAAGVVRQLQRMIPTFQPERDSLPGVNLESASANRRPARAPLSFSSRERRLAEELHARLRHSILTPTPEQP